MADFAKSTIPKRIEVLEDALADVLRPIGEIMHNSDGERCIAVRVMLTEFSGEWQLTSLWGLARALEARLS
jgi:hypothetical protein